ncbi:MAG: hypothetical protein WBE91_20335, partial [Steroidobacteraceae bacterium]
MQAPDPSSDDSRLLRSIPPSRLALIERIVRTRVALRRGFPASDAMRYREVQQRFLRAYFRGVGEEDLAERTPATLAGEARSHLELGWRRAPGQSLVWIFNPDRERDGFESPHTLVQIVTDDRPFLVDSVGIAFARAGLAMHLIVHPVLEVRRDGRGRLAGLGANGGEPYQAESWELYEVDRQTDPAALERLRHDIESTLTDVTLAVDDWPAMRERVRSLVADLERDPPSLPSDDVSEARQLLEWMEERHFVFLGYRYYRLERGADEDRLIAEPRSGLGILRTRGAGGR